jgi:hypothetical protein
MQKKRPDIIMSGLFCLLLKKGFIQAVHWHHRHTI